MFLPGLLLGLVSCWHRGILKTVISHPSIVLLPTFTHFTFASSTKWCKGSSKEEEKEEEEEEEGEKAGGESEGPFIVFSAKFTLFNLLISTLGIIGYCLSMTHIEWIAGWDEIDRGIPWYLRHYLYHARHNIPFILVPILGLLLTLLFLALTSTTRQTCCSHPRPNSCFTLPNVEFGALLPSRLHAHYVLDANSRPILVPEEEEVMRREETEMVELVAN